MNIVDLYDPAFSHLCQRAADGFGCEAQKIGNVAAAHWKIDLFVVSKVFADAVGENAEERRDLFDR